MRAALLAAVALGLTTGCQKPDVILLTIDTLRVDHLGVYNPDSPARTPHLDALAQDAVVYEQAWSPISVTGPAFCTLHTGQLPGTHGVTMNLFRGGDNLPKKARTLAEALDDDGYHTGAFVSGFTLRSRLGLVQGFDRYDQPADNRREGRQTADRMMAWATDEVPQGKPIFAWWHTYDPHGPLSPWGDRPDPGTWPHDPDDIKHLPEYQRLYGVSAPSFYAQRYARAVEHTDEQVGRILTWLQDQGRYDDALIVVTADHGETFTERPLWFDHGTTPYEEQLHVPLLIKYPDGWGANTRSDALVGLHDVMPTILDVLDEPIPKRVEGHSLRDPDHQGHALLTGESSHCKNEPVLRCQPVGPTGKVVAARDHAHTLVRTPTGAGPLVERFDRESDPTERVPLDPSGAPEALRAAVNAMAEDRAHRDYSGYDTPARSAAEDDDEAAALEALGYRDR